MRLFEIEVDGRRGTIVGYRLSWRDCSGHIWAVWKDDTQYTRHKFTLHTEQPDLRDRKPGSGAVRGDRHAFDTNGNRVDIVFLPTQDQQM